MPLFEYRCPRGHLTEALASSFEGSREALACGECGAVAGRIISAPNFYLPWNPGQMTGKDMLEGTPFEDDDGRDHPGYKSSRVSVEVGK